MKNSVCTNTSQGYYNYGWRTFVTLIGVVAKRNDGSDDELVRKIRKLTLLDKSVIDTSVARITIQTTCYKSQAETLCIDNKDLGKKFFSESPALTKKETSNLYKTLPSQKFGVGHS